MHRPHFCPDSTQRRALQPDSPPPSAPAPSDVAEDPASWRALDGADVQHCEHVHGNVSSMTGKAPEHPRMQLPLDDVTRMPVRGSRAAPTAVPRQAASCRAV